MLVITRKEGEAVHVGGQIVVRVLSISGLKVQLGIDAPRSVTIRRGELLATAEPEQAESDADARRPGFDG